MREHGTISSPSFIVYIGQHTSVYIYIRIDHPGIIFLLHYGNAISWINLRHLNLRLLHSQKLMDRVSPRPQVHGFLDRVNRRSRKFRDVDRGGVHASVLITPPMQSVNKLCWQYGRSLIAYNATFYFECALDHVYGKKYLSIMAA